MCLTTTDWTPRFSLFTRPPRLPRLPRLPPLFRLHHLHHLSPEAMGSKQQKPITVSRTLNQADIPPKRCGHEKLTGGGFSEESTLFSPPSTFIHLSWCDPHFHTVTDSIPARSFGPPHCTETRPRSFSFFSPPKRNEGGRSFALRLGEAGRSLSSENTNNHARLFLLPPQPFSRRFLFLLLLLQSTRRRGLYRFDGLSRSQPSSRLRED